MTLTVWFIRHGESESNAGLPTADSATTPLTPKGVEQAERLAQIFQEPPTLLVVSPYLRSQQTAAPIMQRFPAVPLVEWPVQEFTYLARPPGHITTPLERKPRVEAFWHQCDPYYRDGGWAESFADLMERLQQVLLLLQAREGGFLAVISHGLFMRALYWTLLTNSFEISHERMQRFHHLRASFSVPNTAILKLVWQGEQVWMSPLIATHLSGHESYQSGPLPDAAQQQEE
jgi:broad specificity phosphatase PhoE